MQIKSFYLAGLLLIMAFPGCKKIHYFPDREIHIDAPKLIAHRGGRNSQYRENTMAGIRAALRHMDGVEVDVQISKDESIWLSHDADVIDCAQSLTCFPECRDADLKAITTCNGVDISYSQLEELFSLVHDSFPSAIICIDLKGWMPCSGNSLGIEGMMRLEGKIIAALTEKYGLADNVLIETETSSVLTYIRSLNGQIKLYQNSYGDFERAMLICLNYGYDGISYKTNLGETLDKEKMDMLHRKGLKLIAWNLKDQSEAQGLMDMGVDYIQVDL